jgi:hypothetical protein
MFVFLGNVYTTVDFEHINIYFNSELKVFTFTLKSITFLVK